MFVVGCFFFLPFPGWAQFIGFITSAFAISFGSGPLVVGALRRQVPDQERPFTLPGGDVLPYLAFLASGLLVFWAGWAINEKMFIALLAGYVVFGIYSRVARDRCPRWTSRPARGSRSRSAAWRDQLPRRRRSRRPGRPRPPARRRTARCRSSGGFVVIAVFSAVMYAYAIAVRLAARRAAENISRTPNEAPTAT